MRQVSYSLGGLHVHTEFPLRGLLPEAGAAAPDIRIVLGHGAVPSGVPVFAWPGRYGLRLAALDDEFLFTSARDGAFMVSKTAGQVQCFPDAHPGADNKEDEDKEAGVPDGMAQLLMRRILPRVAQMHGRIGLHGASIMLNRHDALLVLGTSGAGKSTLSVALHEELGWSVLSDDISLIDAATTPARCFSVVHGACLWPDSLRALAGGNKRSRGLPAHDQKRWREFDGLLPGHSALVRAMIFLDPDTLARDPISLRPLRPPQALVGAMRQLVRFNPRDNLALESKMQGLARLLQHTPAYILAYPRSYSALPAVARFLCERFAVPFIPPSLTVEYAGPW